MSKSPYPIKTDAQIVDIARQHGFFFVRSGPCAHSGHHQTQKRCEALCRKGVLRYSGRCRKQNAYYHYVGPAGSTAAQTQADRITKQKARRKAQLFTRAKALTLLKQRGGTLTLSKKAHSRRANSLRSHLLSLVAQGKVSLSAAECGSQVFTLTPQA